jgi:pectinesterase
MKTALLLLLSFSTTLQLRAHSDIYNMVVASDGTGKYRTVQEAFNAAPDNSNQRTTIFIKHGVYKQKLILSATKKK